jgi:hypothetical protein
VTGLHGAGAGAEAEAGVVDDRSADAHGGRRPTTDRDDHGASERSSDGHAAAFHELYALPDPDSSRYVVIASGYGGGLVHVGTFDAAELDGSPSDDRGRGGACASVSDGGATASSSGRYGRDSGER